MNNPYLPYPVRIDDIRIETEDRSLKTFQLVFINPEDAAKFTYQAGQFAEISITGEGEIPIGIASSPSEAGYLRFTVFKTGKVTSHLHQMAVGDQIRVRGPLGNGYPWEILRGKNILIIGGGFAFTTLRSAIVMMLAPGNRSSFGKIDVVYGARMPGMLLYKSELMEWEKRDDIRMHITVDKADDPHWPYHEGFVPNITQKVAPPADANTYALICGPPVMIKFTLPILEEKGYDPSRILMSLENRMKCGIGMCGRCNIGKELVCKDGPVFTLKHLRETPMEY
jgi:sulfhydrogenase subunit gamma (sulfur reductase)